MGLIGQGFALLSADMEDDGFGHRVDIRRIIEHGIDSDDRTEWYELTFSVSPTCNLQFNANTLADLECFRDQLSAAIEQRKSRDAEIAAIAPPRATGERAGE